MQYFLKDFVIGQRSERISDLISRQDAIDAIEKAYERGYTVGQIVGHKKGKWIKISPADIYECSKCGQNVMTIDIDVYRWCHGCGAKMEEGEKDG